MLLRGPGYINGSVYTGLRRNGAKVEDGLTGKTGRGVVHQIVNPGIGLPKELVDHMRGILTSKIR